MSRGLGEPNSIAVDYYNYEVCWADGGRKEMGITPRIGEIIDFLSTRTFRLPNISKVQWTFLFLPKNVTKI